MYPSDFEAPRAAFASVDDPLFLGLPPLLATIFFLLLLAIAAGAYLFGRWHADQTGGSDADRAPDDIHKAVLAASTAALAAPLDQLKSRAQALRGAISDYLGPVLEVGKGVAGPVENLDAALKGEIEDAPKPEKAHDPSPAHPAPASVPPVAVTQIFVGGPGPAAHPPAADDHAKLKPESKPETRAMTGPEQIDALSRSVRAFHDHWSRGPERIRELRQARAALSRRPPASALKSDGGRVWDRH